MSNKICGKNIVCDSLRATIKVLEAVPEKTKVLRNRIAGMKAQVELKSNPFVSRCTMCGRKYREGDATCSCHPATTISVRKDGVRTKVECPERVVGLENRHLLRSKMHQTIRDDKKHLRALRTLASIASRPVRSGKFNENSPNGVEESHSA